MQRYGTSCSVAIGGTDTTTAGDGGCLIDNDCFDRRLRLTIVDCVGENNCIKTAGSGGCIWDKWVLQNACETGRSCPAVRHGAGRNGRCF